MVFFSIARRTAFNIACPDPGVSASNAIKTCVNPKISSAVISKPLPSIVDLAKLSMTSSFIIPAVLSPVLIALLLDNADRMQ